MKLAPKVKRVLAIGSAGLLTGVLLLLTAVGIYADVSSGSPHESTEVSDPAADSNPQPAAIGNTPTEVAAPSPGAPELTPPPDTESLSEPETTTEASDPAAECDRRLAANESVFVEALESGEGAAFHCTTTCTEPDVDLVDSRAGNVEELQVEVNTFVTSAASAGDEAADKLCLTESGYGAPEIEARDTSNDDAFIPADSGLQDPIVPAAGDTSGSVSPGASTPPPASEQAPTEPGSPQPTPPSSAPTSDPEPEADETSGDGGSGDRPPRDAFIPEDVFERQDYPSV